MDTLTRNELLAMQSEMQEFQAYLKALHTVTMALSGVEALDALYRRTIELGRSQLGFDRLGLLLLEENRYMVGTFGTDEAGNLRDERYFRSEAIEVGVLEVLNQREGRTSGTKKCSTITGSPSGRGGA